MLKKCKIWTYNNFHLVLGLSIGGFFFYLSLLMEWALVLFFIIFFFLNFYFIKGVKLAVSTFLAPLPFLLIQTFFNFNIALLTLIWLITLILLWKKETLFWFLHMFLVLLISQFILGNVIIQPFFIILAVFLFNFLIFFVVFGQKSSSAFIRSFIVSESLWLLYFLPVGFIIRAIINFIFLYLILGQNGLPYLRFKRTTKERALK